MLKGASSKATSWKTWLFLGVVIVLAVVVALKSSQIASVTERLTPPQLPPAPQRTKTVAIEQNWSSETRRRFHHISQGTSTFPVPFEWIMALEQPEPSVWGMLWPGTQPQFFEPEHMRRFGFIEAPVDQDNPHGLPVGFALTPLQNLKGVRGQSTALGLTCAACHTGHFTYEDTEYVVDGGPATANLDALTDVLGAALGQTALSGALPLPNRRFNRFARRVLGDTYSATTRNALLADLEAVLASAKPDQFKVLEGHGRLDALNRIGNQVFSDNIDRPQNYVPISAPVNFPHIWTAMWFDWVQYDGSIMQPLVRNAGEALGVHANVNMTAPVGQGRFSSAVAVENLDWIENTLAGSQHPGETQEFGGLLSPKWPDGLPALDRTLRDKGKALYQKHCAGCHLPALNSPEFWSGNHFRRISYTAGGITQQTDQSYLALNIIPVAEMNTDPAQARVLTERTVDTAANELTGTHALGLNAVLCVRKPQSSTGADYSERKSGENPLIEVRITDGPKRNFGLALAALVQNVNDAWFDNALIPETDRSEFEGGRPNCIQALAGYKARPLNGVWATAPFLHNGSVPTLDDLLRPADQRPRFVQLGTLEFDPVKVGVKQPDLSRDSYPPYVDGLSVLDTSLAGNLNTGHAFGASSDGNTAGVIGPEFTGDERKAIIEFLKSY